MVLIDKDTVSGVSATFEVGNQLTVFAANLAGSDYVEFEIVALTPPKKAECECPPTVVLPAVNWSAPLKCCGQAVRLTAAQPFVLIDHPQHIKMRARLVTTDVGWSDKIVWAESTNVPNPTDRMRGCPCD